jgi:hypothetical protein
LAISLRTRAAPRSILARVAGSFAIAFAFVVAWAMTFCPCGERANVATLLNSDAMAMTFFGTSDTGFHRHPPGDGQQPRRDTRRLVSSCGAPCAARLRQRLDEDEVHADSDLAAV